MPRSLPRFAASALRAAKPGDVGHLHRLVERRVVVAGVVEQRDRRLVRERADEVAAADLVLRDVHLDRGLVHEALDHVRRFRPARAAIRVDRHRVGERRGDFAVDRPASCTGPASSVAYRIVGMHDANVDRYAPIVAVVCDAHREELAVLVERELGVRHVVAAVRVGEERFAALARPLDRAVDALRRPDHRGLFGVQVDLGAEAAADVGRDHAHLVLRQPEHERRHQQALDVRILVRRRRACSCRRRGCTTRPRRAARSRWAPAGC